MCRCLPLCSTLLWLQPEEIEAKLSRTLGVSQKVTKVDPKTRTKEAGAFAKNLSSTSHGWSNSVLEFAPLV